MTGSHRPPVEGVVTMTRSLGRWQALLLGLIMLSGLALGVGGLFAVGNRSWFGAQPLEVLVTFDSIRGVEVGTRVRIQGVDAGEVAAVDLPGAPGGPVTLRLRLRGDHRHLVCAGSTVQIVSEGLIGAKVLEVRGDGIRPGTPAAEAVADGATLRSRPPAELADLLGEVNTTLQSLRNGEGTVAKLVNDRRAYEALVALLERSQDTMSAFQQDAEAFKRLPVVRGYVEDPVALLVRPRCERYRQWFSADDLFEPGRAVLTSQGQQRLDELGPWLAGLKQKGSDVVVVSYADPKSANAQIARTLTAQQAEAVVDYLKKQHAVQKLGWFRSRAVKALGLGTGAPPAPEAEALSPGRVEVLVFVPQ